ncbi:MAG: response regulator transcription factor [Bacteroidales bacterium]|nr:response regulator transcription factor [Bacteroidales bacterium]
MEKKIRVLLAEDDVNLGSLLKQYLDAKQYSTDLFNDGVKALDGFSRNYYDICILDIMMPKKDGFSVASEIREINNKIPIIFLTAKTLKEDVLNGFKIGADDYITKPFNMEELLLRIEAVLRRSGALDSEEVSIFNIGDYNFDCNKQTLQYLEQEPEKLTTKESDLLKLLCINVNKVLERNYALKQIWEDDNYFNARSMDVYITKLRKKLKDDNRIEILNIHGKGYKLIVGDELA